MKKINLLLALMFISNVTFAKDINYPSNLHGYVSVYSYYVPTPCEVNACNAISIELIKEFYDNLDDSNREYENFKLYPFRLQKIAHEEKSALAYSMIDMSAVVLNDINQKKLAQINNMVLKELKKYYKTNELDNNNIIKIEMSIRASKYMTMLNYSTISALEYKNGKNIPRDVSGIMFALNNVLQMKMPIISDKENLTEIRIENSYITNNYDFLANH